MRTLTSWFFVVALALPTALIAQLRQIPIKDLSEAQKHDPRDVVLLITTDWCQYCKAMTNTTFKNKEVVQLLNEGFHFVELNAGHKEDILFNRKVFRYRPTGINTGIHELAELFIKEKSAASFPLLIILNSDYEIRLKYAGYINSEDMTEILIQVSNRTP